MSMKPKTPRDRVETEALVLDCQAGDDAAVNRLIRLWQSRFLGFARRAGLDDEEAWDAVQESWIAVIRGLPRLRDPALFPRWSFRIVNNKCVDRIRAAQRRRRATEALRTEAEADAAAAPVGGVLDLRGVIDTLSPDQATLLHLKYIAGLTQPEIAEALDIPVGTVKSRLHTLLDRLRTVVEGTDDDNLRKETT